MLPAFYIPFKYLCIKSETFTEMSTCVYMVVEDLDFFRVQWYH